MPSLIIEQPDRRSTGRVTGRVLIGRLPTNGIVVPESNVSRLHAWVDRDFDGHHYIADGGSLGGTWVNGRAIERRRLLGDGDVIRIGTTQIVYSLDDELPEGVDQINLDGQRPGTDVNESGVLFNCPCGAPVWFKAAAIGQIHVCRQCGRTVLIPAEPGAVAEVVSSPSIAEPGVPPKPSDSYDNYSDLLQNPPVPQPHPTDEYGLAEMSSDVTATAPTEAELGSSATEHLQTSETDVTDGESGEREALFEKWRHSAVPEMVPSPLEEAVITADSSEEEHDHPIDAELDLTAATPETHTVEEVCSICHSTISTDEQTTACPSCGLTFHADCWQENYGCSAYGCPQVNALKPPETEETPDAAVEEEAVAIAAPTGEDEIASTEFPWEFVFVATSVVGSLLGALAYGIPALIGAIGTSIYLAAYQDSRQRRAIAVIALVVCILGAAGGIYASYIWWNGWPPVGPWAHRKG